MRCYAVMAVLFSHFFSFKITKHVYIGIAGVDLFFVISGFLITEILFRYKETGATLQQNLKKFYIRRSMRIFPIYYLYLFVAALLFRAEAGPSLPYAFGYIINFYQQQHEVPLFFEHLWSLSIEEQFYLLWPLLILTVPQKHLLKLIAGAIAVAVLSRIFITGINHKLLTSSCFDAFGLGALFAYLKNYDREQLQKILRFRLAWKLGLAIYLGVVLLSVFNLHYLDPYFRLSVSVVSFYLIGAAIFPGNKQRFFALKLLENKTAMYIGQISYGVYIYHLMVAYLAEPYVNTFLLKSFGDTNSFLKYIYYNSYLVKFPLYSVLAIGVATLSFRYIEKPITVLKNRVTK